MMKASRTFSVYVRLLSYRPFFRLFWQIVTHFIPENGRAPPNEWPHFIEEPGSEINASTFQPRT